MKKIVSNFKKMRGKLKKKMVIVINSIVSTFIFFSCRVYAASGTESIDSFINFACDWLTKIGGVVALVGRRYVCTWLAKRRRRR